MYKYFLLTLILVSSNLYSQYYTSDNFNLKGQINRVSVVCYDIEEIEGLFIEGFPYSSQSRYHTDLNLHYLEFDKDGKLSRSKLYYPRDFYGQFSWLSPQFDLESSDFGKKKNYLTSMYRYKYSNDQESLKITISSEDGTDVNLFLDNDNRLTEDEYYTYTVTSDKEKKVLTKRRKGSRYGYRRMETVDIDGTEVVNEYINNRFLVSKKLTIKKDNTLESIFVSQSRIELIKEISNSSNLVIEKRFVNLNWRNKFLKWPDIDFDINLDYSGYLNMLERENEELGISYLYNDRGLITTKTKFRYNGDKKIPLTVTSYIYDSNEQLLKVLINAKPLESEDLYFKEYIYDDKGNWIVKTVGYEISKNEKMVRIPIKKYLKTLTYWD